MDHNSDSSSDKWRLCGENFPRAQVVYLFQVTLIYIIVLAAIANLTIGSQHDQIWIALLGAATGVLLPTPTLKKHYGTAKPILPHHSILHDGRGQHNSQLQGGAAPPH